MKLNLFVAICASLFLGSTSAVEPPPGAGSVVQAYSSAFNRADCHAVLDLMSPVYVASLDRTSLCNLLNEMATEGVVDTLGELVSVHKSGDYVLAFYENERIGRDRVRQISYYAVHSPNGGKTWYVLDNVCNNEAWLKKVYPPFNANISLPNQRMLLPPYFVR
jgi:hypothetical protein